MADEKDRTDAGRVGGGRRDFAFVRRRCAETARRLLDDFDRKRRAVLTDVARWFHPVGVAGLAMRAEDLADECARDDEHPILSAFPVNALRKGACGFHGNLTSPARRWFRFRDAGRAGGGNGGPAADPALLDRLTEAVELVMRGSDLYPNLYRLYEHVLCYGFGAMLVTKGRGRAVVSARTLRMGTYALGVDDAGKVCRLARRFSWTAEQVLSGFGPKNAPRRVKDAAANARAGRRWTVVNLIEPDASGDMRAYDPVSRALRLADDMTFRSVYWLEDAKDDDPNGGVLAASGFSVCPIVAPRIECELGDAYGRGRGMDALCLARGLQSFQSDILSISGVKGRPPLVVASEFKDEGFRAGRGGVNYARFGQQNGALAVPVFARPPDTADIRIDRQDMENEIAELFFNPSFAAIDSLKNNPGVKTATEVDALVRENMERLNPVVTNFDRELLDPLVTVCARHAVAACASPLEPADVEALADGVDVEYVSQIHMAARAAQTGAVDSWVQRVANLAGARPEVLDKVDADGAADAWADMMGVPASVRASDEAVAAARAARAEQARAQQEAAQLQSAAQAARIGSVPTDEGHLGGALMRGLQGDATEGMA